MQRGLLIAGAVVVIAVAVYTYSKIKNTTLKSMPQTQTTQPPQTQTTQPPQTQTTQPPQTQTTQPPQSPPTQPQTQTQTQTQPTQPPTKTDPLPSVAAPKDAPDPGSVTAAITPPDLAVQTFARPGTWSYVPPDGVTKVRVSVLGGGGGGGHIRTRVRGEGGYGEPGQLVQQVVAVTPGVAVPVTVGAGGAGALGYLNPYMTVDRKAGNATAGGSSSFGSVIARGGQGAYVSDLNQWAQFPKQDVLIDGEVVGQAGRFCTETTCGETMNAVGVGAAGAGLANDAPTVSSGAGAPGLVRVEPQA